MISYPIFVVALRTERDVVRARQLARDIAAEVGLDNQEQIRIATAASEMARNAFRYARGGKVTFALQLETPQAFEVTVTDTGPGIPHLQNVLDGQYRSTTGMGMGIVGTRRLMDDFSIETSSAGTSVRMTKQIPRSRAVITRSAAHDLSEKLQKAAPENPYGEIERQNQELLKTLQELRSRQEDLELLNRELEDTNRGVVALYAELDERADYLRRASELKTKFLSNVSHEFRTPLNSIISLTQLLLERLDGELSREQEKQVRYIESSARDLQELVNDLLDLAKVEAGKTRIRPKHFEVAELFSALKGMLKPLLANNSSVELVFDDPAEVPPLYTDEGKVSQILRNLISNALKFTPDGQVTVKASGADPGSVLFSVSDSGIGIPPEHLDSIFLEFSQVDNPLQELHRGTGLGLPLCRNFATLLGGRIWVESAVGHGSSFHVQIPAEYPGDAITGKETAAIDAPDFFYSPVLIFDPLSTRSQDMLRFLRGSEFQPILATRLEDAEVWLAHHRPHLLVLAESSGNDAAQLLTALRKLHPGTPVLAESSVPGLLDGAEHFKWPLHDDDFLQHVRRLTATSGVKRLLLVDDNDVARYVVREVLISPELRIEEASCGKAALAALDSHPPDALILDLLMPDMTGLEILRQLRRASATADLPVLIYTSKPLNESELLEIQGLGAGVLAKHDVSTRLSPQPFLDWLKAAHVLSTEIQ